MKSGAVVSCKREPAHDSDVARSLDVIPGQDNGHIVRCSAFKGSAHKLASGPVNIGSLVQHTHDLRLIEGLGQAIGAEQQQVAVSQLAAVDLDLHALSRAAHDVGDDVPPGMLAGVPRG